MCFACLNRGVKAKIDGDDEVTCLHVTVAIRRVHCHPVLFKQPVCFTRRFAFYINAANAFGNMLKFMLESKYRIGSEFDANHSDILIPTGVFK